MLTLTNVSFSFKTSILSKVTTSLVPPAQAAAQTKMQTSLEHFSFQCGYWSKTSDYIGLDFPGWPSRG